MKKIITLVGLVLCTSVFSNTPISSFWQDTDTFELQQRGIAGDAYQDNAVMVKRRLRLDKESLVEFLNDSKLAARPTEGADYSSKVIDLPLPNGDFVKVQILESDLLSDEIKEQYPDINAWRVIGIDDPSITGRIDITPNGFHGMLVLSNGDTVYIDPDDKFGTDFYSSFSKTQNHDHFKTEFNCKLHDDHTNGIKSFRKDIPKLAGKSLAELPNPNLITYRLALAGTAEYMASQGGTAAKAYASMVTTINRVNEIYQRDLGIKLQLISDESLIYTNPDSDPYTNNSAQSLVYENIENINNKIGVDNYDIGHVFAQGPLGGLAFAGSACQENYKAGGATGTPTPNGETFSIEYVAHELGHQLGATHSFNSQQRSCGGNSRVQITAVEPGSGSTIMSYSGLCGTDNIQTVSDAVFHWASINQISEYTRNDIGSSCGARVNQTNNDVEANAGEDLVIPANTPFMLSGSSKGGVTYSWDQIDTGSVSSVDEDLGDNAIIRSLVPKATESRFIPTLESLFSDEAVVGETLPVMDRDLNFAFVARDENGAIATDYKKISVVNTNESFKVLSQANEQSLFVGQTIDVEWAVASTNTAPINCIKIDIQLLSSDGIQNLLLAETDNDGYEQVTITELQGMSNPVRVMVNCSDNSFFQVSAANLTLGEKSNGSSGEKSKESVGGGSWNWILLSIFMLIGLFRYVNIIDKLNPKRIIYN